MFTRSHPLMLWARVFAGASLIHLTLPDIQAEGWGFPAALEAIGALALLVRPHPVAFALCAVGTLWPLLMLRDVLTQSTLLTVWAGLGIVGTLGKRWAQPALTAVRWTTAGTYGLAAVHKLNSAFFDPQYSCANHAWAQIADRYTLPDPAWLAPVWAPLAVGIEVLMVVLLLRRSRWIWPVGLLFHLPLTVTLAPAFGPVMLAGYAAGLTPRHRVCWRQILRHRWPLLVVAGVTTAAVEMIWVGWAAPFKVFKVSLFGVLMLGSLLTVRGRDPWGTSQVHILPVVALSLWLAHGLMPYTGIQYQHTAAMLSNLRVDPGCANSWVLPSGLWIEDPYLHISVAKIGHGQRPGREGKLREILWNIPALHTMHRNWCVPENRPIYLKGQWRKQPFLIPDLCAEDWLNALPGAEYSLPGWQRYQKNLRRECPTACVH